MSGLRIRVTENRPFARTVYLDGRLTNDTVAMLSAELDKIAGSTANVVVFDLSDLEYVSSAGLRVIFAAQKLMTSRGGKALLINPKPPVRKVLEIVNAVDVSAVFASVEELDRYLDMMQRRVSEGQ